MYNIKTIFATSETEKLKIIIMASTEKHFAFLEKEIAKRHKIESIETKANGSHLYAYIVFEDINYFPSPVLWDIVSVDFKSKKVDLIANKKTLDAYLENQNRN